MADRYVSASGSNTSPYETWATAATSLLTATAIAAAGEKVYVDSAFTENPGANSSYNLADGVQVLSVDKTGDPEPPLASDLLAGATIDMNNTFLIELTGHGYFYGLTFITHTSGSSSNDIQITSDSNTQRDLVIENCTFEFAATSSGGNLTFGSGGNNPSCNFIRCIDCTFTAGGSASKNIQIASVRLEFVNCVFDDTGTAQTTIFNQTDESHSVCLWEGCDFQGANTNLFDADGNARGGHYTLNYCKIPSGVSLTNADPNRQSMRYTMNMCDSGDTPFIFEDIDYFGEMADERTIVKTGGASDGTDSIAWAVTAHGTVELAWKPYQTPPIAKWNETTGSSITVEVDIFRDSATDLNDDDIWLEVQYLGTSGNPLALRESDRVANVLTTPAAHASSGATWGGTHTNPNEQKLSVSFTPQEKGYIIARVCHALANETIYVDPVLQVS